MVGFELVQYLSQRKVLVEEALGQFLPLAEPETIYQAMRYSLLAGGKRLRPILCLASCELLGGRLAWAVPTACALEMIHTMSLIHDDLPAMDNDDLRRGQPTNHKVYGEAMAILAGDGLLAYAFEVMATQTPAQVQPAQVLAVVARLGRAASASGLVGGQVMDLQSEGKPIPLTTLQTLHAKKTGALLEVAVVSGGILAGGGTEELGRLSRYAQKIGLAFQIVDDILDITGTPEKIGKTIGKDVAVQKATYPSLLGLECSQNLAQQLTTEAKTELIGFGERAVPLLALADFITQREH
ncbi:geranylgeranyl diphosphate synthase CrtE [Candidatus Cyanaurora vandensis]|uniref:geranylgeranyl diphosphate synthase CrtE n=1 Tax=Candidatus Cyanaurora vandensis TaxID=2714958 RepID=UPI00257AB4F2|nr:farnesyl diphosphate synthase [Candidatus Cyanaurora vandensis]